MTIRHRALMAVTAISVLTVLTGCGGSSSKSVTTTTPRTTTSSPAAGMQPLTTTTTTTTTLPAPLPSATVELPVAPAITTEAPVLPTTTVQVAVPPAPQAKPAPAPAPPKVSYKSCAEVKAAGAAPLHRGDPGYSSSLDRDGDGIACEK